MKSWLAFCLAVVLPFSGKAQYLVRYDVPRSVVSYWQVKGRDTVPVRLIPVAAGRTVNLELQHLPASFRESLEYRVRETKAEVIQNPWWPSAAGENGASALAALLPARTKLMQAFPGGEAEVINKQAETGNMAAWSRYVGAWNHYMKRYDAWQEAVLFESACRQLYHDLLAVRYSFTDDPDGARAALRTRTEALFPGATDNPVLFTRQSLTAVPSQTMADSLLSLFIPLQALQPAFPAADSLQLMAVQRQQAVQRYRVTQNGPDAGDLVLRIGETYRQLRTDPYQRLLPLQVRAETEAVVVRLWPDADSSVRQTLGMKGNDTLSRLIPLAKKRPLRFRNSFGMSFVHFADTRWNYFVRTGSVNVIDREPGDLVRPVAVTLLHFYAPRDRGFRWGGHIGAGLPLSGDERNLNILMGLSTFLGREDPISISLGVSAAQVNRLTRYRLGEVVTITELNTKTDFNAVYRLGFFFGITFNPSGLNANN